MCVEARTLALAEDKRILEQQIKSRQTPLTRTVAVGDHTIDEAFGGTQRPGSDFPSDVQVVRKVNLGSLKKPSRDIGVGDGDVTVSLVQGAYTSFFQNQFS